MQKLEVAMEQSINLREYLDILKRRRIIVILVMIICLGLGGYKTYVNYESYVPTYRSSVTVRINSTKNVKKKKLKTYSGGMIRRIGIAQALLNNPEILILDEPTAGLDPKERVRFRNVISSLGKNRMVLLSTHIVSDIDYIADRILIMKNGELIQEGTEKEITDKVEGCVWKCIVSEKEAGQITSSFIVSNMRSRGESVELRIVSKRQPVVGAENIESTLEDAYLYHTQITGGEKNATL